MSARTEWLLARRRGIGSSDAAGVCGVSRFSSPYSVYADKVDEGEPMDSDDPVLEWGRRLEPVAAAWYADLSGRRVELARPWTIERHPTLAWLFATPDARQWDEARGEGLVELKAPLPWTADEWKAGPPLAYQVQLQHQLEVTGLPWGSIVALFPGERPRWYDCDRDEAFVAALVATEASFWRCVEERRPPEPDGAQATAEALQRLYRREDGSTVELSEEAASWHADLEEAKEMMRASKAARARLEGMITARMGTATCGVIPGVPGRYTWQNRRGAQKRVLRYAAR